MEENNKKNFTEKCRGNPWIVSTIVFGGLCLFLMFYCTYFNNQDLGVYQDIFVNKILIGNQISFYYFENSLDSQKQIKDFGDYWEDYKKSGLVVNCDSLDDSSKDYEFESKVCELMGEAPVWINATKHPIQQGYIDIRESIW